MAITFVAELGTANTTDIFPAGHSYANVVGTPADGDIEILMLGAQARDVALQAPPGGGFTVLTTDTDGTGPSDSYTGMVMWRVWDEDYASQAFSHADDFNNPRADSTGVALSVFLRGVNASNPIGEVSLLPGPNVVLNGETIIVPDPLVAHWAMGVWLRAASLADSRFVIGRYYNYGSPFPDSSIAGWTAVALEGFSEVGSEEGRVGIGTGVQVFLKDDADAFVPVAPAPALGSPTDRYRLNLSADSRSLLASASAVPFDASASVALPPAVGLLPQQTLYPVRELTRDATAATYDASFYPRATQNDRQERTYDGVTILSRMQTAYPARVFASTTDLGISSSAKAIITYLLGQWATEFSWFGFETVPDLRFPVPGSTGVKTPSEYTVVDVPRPQDGGVSSSVVALPQDDENRRSMYDILQDLLSPFPGTVFFQNSSGNLEIVPAYGPDADETPYKTLGSDDVVSMSLGEPSIGTIINRCTVSSRGYQRSTAVEVMQPAWFQVGAQQLFGESVWYTPAVDRVNLQEPSDSTTGAILQEDDLTSADGFTAQTPGVWPQSTSAIPAGDGISLVDGSSASLVTVGWSRYTTLTGGSPGLAASGTTGLTLLRNTIPFLGGFEPTLEWEGTVGLYNFVLQVDAAWDAEKGGVVFRLNPSSVLSRLTGNFITDEFVIEFTLNDESVGYAETSGVTATFGTTSTTSESPIPNSDGSTDAVAESQATYGVQEERIDVRGYVLNAEQALAMAQGIVLANLTPRAIRSLELGWRGSTVALFDDRGRLFGTPDSGEGLLVGVEYQDDFISVTGGKRVRVEETVPSLPGFIPSDTEWLLNDDNSFWTNDDGTYSEPA